MTAARLRGVCDSSVQATGPSGRSLSEQHHTNTCICLFTLQTQSRLRPGVVSHGTKTHTDTNTITAEYYGEQMLAVTEGSVDLLTCVSSLMLHNCPFVAVDV